MTQQQSDNTTFTINPGGSLKGEVHVLGDKSISHRALMLGAIAKGTTSISNFLPAEDTLATLTALEQLGVPIERPENKAVKIAGVGPQGLKTSVDKIDLGNSGTSIRLLTGLLAGHNNIQVTLTGDQSLSQRPMKRITDPLKKMGANVLSSPNGTPPLTINSSEVLEGIEYTMPIASAQVKSCLLLAGLYAKNTTCVIEPSISRDHTERMLQTFGYPLAISEHRVCLEGGHSLMAKDVNVPGDISAAAFFIVGASIAKGSSILLPAVGINPTRIGIIDIMQKMGAHIELKNRRNFGNEPVADIYVEAGPLQGINITPEMVPLAIDEFPIIFIAAACAAGSTKISGASDLRNKESDRLQAMADGLQTLGINVTSTSDGMVIEGGKMRGGYIKGCGDHRIVMAFAMAGLCASEEIVISDCENVNTSFPTFIATARSAGLSIAAG